MPFDGHLPREPERRAAVAPVTSDMAVCWLVGVTATLLLITPFSLPAAVDLVRYLLGG